MMFGAQLTPFGGAYVDLTHPQLIGCRAWWPMWEGGGRFVQDVVGGTPHIGTFGSGALAPTWAAGQNGTVVQFDGSNDVITSPYAEVLVNFTAMARFRATANSNFNRIIDKNFSSNFWLGRSATNANTWGGGVREGAPPYGRFVTLADGEWHHLVTRRQGTTHTIIGDGGKAITSGVVSDFPTDPDSFRIGQNHTSDTPFAGQIYDVRIYNRALSLQEIQNIYENPWAPVVGWNDFDLTFWLEDQEVAMRRAANTTLFLGMGMHL